MMMVDEQKQPFLTARKLSLVLISVLILMIGGLFGGVWYVGTLLSQQAENVRETTAKAQNDVSNLAKAEALAVFTEKNAAEINAAASIVAETKLYQHQNQIVNDITGFATQAGINVLGFSFPETPPSRSKTTSALKSVTAIIRLESPIEYSKLLTFLRLTERNLTRMQVTNMNIAADPTRPGYVLVETIGLEVYVR